MYNYLMDKVIKHVKFLRLLLVSYKLYCHIDAPRTND